MISGLIFGILLGFLLKRGRFCPTGILRDIYMEKRIYNLLLILALIFTQAFLYHLMVDFKLFPRAGFMRFPLLQVALGSFMFGFGAVMANGCTTSSLVKSGDGRMIGILSVLTFIFSAYLAIEGPLRPAMEFFASQKHASDRLLQKLPISPILISGIAALILYILMFRHYQSHKPKFSLPKKYSGLRHIFCEKIWAKEVSVVLIGALGAAAFYFSNLTGRNAGFAISTPLLSWLNLFVKVDLSAGG